MRLLVALLALFPTVLLAQGQGQARAAAPVVNPLAVMAAQVRSTACAGMARTIGEKVLGDGATSGVVLAARQGADQALFSASLESRDGAGAHFVSAFLAPNARGGCDAGYDDVRYWGKPCGELALQDLRGLGLARPLGAQVSTFVMGPNQHVYLLPAGVGCVTVRKEVMF